jgi:uncharacterized protein
MEFGNRRARNAPPSSERWAHTAAALEECRISGRRAGTRLASDPLSGFLPRKLRNPWLVMTHDPIRPLREHVQAVLIAADPAHDFAHVLRVLKNASTLAEAEGAKGDICQISALLHELVNLPKDHPESHRSGELCATAAHDLLDAHGFASDVRDRVTECIRVHAFSAGLTARSLEAQILQDADRLDALGAIGIARCFATCSSMKRPFYCSEDPFALHRALDDKQYGVDHFFKKLLRIPERLNTSTARLLAEERVAFLRQYLQQLGSEIGVTEPLAFP